MQLKTQSFMLCPCDFLILAFSDNFSSCGPNFAFSSKNWSFPKFFALSVKNLSSNDFFFAFPAKIWSWDKYFHISCIIDLQFWIKCKNIGDFFQFSLKCLGKNGLQNFSRSNLFSELGKLWSTCKKSEVFLVFLFTQLSWTALQNRRSFGHETNSFAFFENERTSVHFSQPTIKKTATISYKQMRTQCFSHTASRIYDYPTRNL